ADPQKSSVGLRHLKGRGFSGVEIQDQYSLRELSQTISRCCQGHDGFAPQAFSRRTCAYAQYRKLQRCRPDPTWDDPQQENKLTDSDFPSESDVLTGGLSCRRRFLRQA